MLSPQESCGLCSCSEEAQDSGGLAPKLSQGHSSRGPSASTQPCTPDPRKTPDSCSLSPHDHTMPLAPWPHRYFFHSRPPCSSLTPGTRVPSTCLLHEAPSPTPPPHRLPRTELCAHTEPTAKGSVVTKHGMLFWKRKGHYGEAKEI